MLIIHCVIFYLPVLLTLVFKSFIINRWTGHISIGLFLIRIGFIRLLVCLFMAFLGQRTLNWLLYCSGICSSFAKILSFRYPLILSSRGLPLNLNEIAFVSEKSHFMTCFSTAFINFIVVLNSLICWCPLFYHFDLFSRYFHSWVSVNYLVMKNSAEYMK